jgi:hypothetical protein
MEDYTKLSDQDLKKQFWIEDKKIEKRHGSLTIKFLELATEQLKRLKNLTIVS